MVAILLPGKKGEKMEYLYIAVPKDIDEYEKKNYIGITVRQLKWIVVAAIVSLLIYALCALAHLYDFGFLLCFLCGLGVFSIGGFQKWHGRPYPEFVKAVIRYHRTKQKIFFYKTEFEKGEKNVQTKKKRSDRKINRQYARECSEWSE